MFPSCVQPETTKLREEKGGKNPLPRVKKAIPLAIIAIKMGGIKGGCENWRPCEEGGSWHTRANQVRGYKKTRLSSVAEKEGEHLFVRKTK